MSHQDIKPRSAQSIVLSTYTLHSAQNQHFGYTKMSQPTEKTGIRSANNRRCWCKQWCVRPQEHVLISCLSERELCAPCHVYGWVVFNRTISTLPEKQRVTAISKIFSWPKWHVLCQIPRVRHQLGCDYCISCLEENHSVFEILLHTANGSCVMNVYF